MTLAFALLALLGLAAGVLTTIAGQGGGLLLLIACSALVGPRAALAITAPALLLGNLQRVLLLRSFLDRSIALRIILGAMPGGLLGGLAAGAMPAWVLRVALVLLTGLAIVKALGWLRFTMPPRAFTPAGLGIGLLAGTAGGAGVLVTPLLLSAGLTGRRLVATTSSVAVAMHVGRVIGYAELGLFSRRLLAYTAVVTAAIFLGNAFGSRIQVALDKRWNGRAQPVVEYGTLVVCVALSVAGLG